MGYIYRITNTVNGKQYIGQTILPYKKRWDNHVYKMEKKDGCPALKNAFLKYGIDKFRFEVLIICFDEDVDRYEKEYIAKYSTVAPNGYNISAGGAATYGFKGKTHSEETRAKLREINLSRFSKEEERERSRATIKAKYENDPDYKSRISEGLKNSSSQQMAKELRLLGNYKRRKHDDFTKEKIRFAIKDYFQNHESRTLHVEKHRAAMAKAVGKKTLKCTLDGKVVAEYSSMKEAARANNISDGSVSNCIKGTCKGIHGFTYRALEMIV